MASLRRTYRLEVAVTVQVDDESLASVTALLEARVNEMLGRLEQKDDVRVVLLTRCDVREVE